MGEKLGVAVIGLGMMGERHARIWSELPQTKLVAVYDLVPERSREVAARLGAEAAESLEAVLARPDVQIVSVCTDDQSHVEPCVKAAQAGKHVLVEKPLATSIEDCDKILGAFGESGTKLMVGHVVRFDPRYATAKQAIADGEVGDIIQAFGRRNNIVASGRRIAPRTSVAYFLGVHDIDILRWFVGSEIVRVYAESCSKVLADVGSEDTIFTVMKFANDAVGCLETCWVVPEGVANTLDARMEVVGTAGRVAVRVGDESCDISSQQRTRRPDIAYGMLMLDQQYGALRTQLEHFADCVINDKEPLVSCEDARAAVAVAAAIHRSLDTGAPVTL
ncbi:Gfo/Idh/MocA family oxidoreductase [bacterium]|nr:Gfo/Idh/MocA family oxidoreductase [bacterium]